MCSQQTPDTCVCQVIQLVCQADMIQLVRQGVKGETTVLISVGGGSLSTMDVGLSTPWNALLSNNTKLWCIRNLHVIMVFLVVVILLCKFSVFI